MRTHRLNPVGSVNLVANMPVFPATAAFVVFLLIFCAHIATSGRAAGDAATTAAESKLQRLLDAPVLFVKRHSYTGIHIYDTYYKWPPGCSTRFPGFSNSEN